MGTEEAQDPPAQGTLGTFAGVFTPSILTILGIILFLRTGNVVGSAGLARALAIVLIANAISILTSISLAAVATNLRVKGGGDYYLISRTLGVEFGGALGLVLFLAQSVSIAFYAIGFGEAVATMVGTGPVWLAQALAGAAVAVLFVLAWLGSDQATRFQFVVMAVLVAALAGFFVGGLQMWDGAQLRANLWEGDGTPFWSVFALFFPAATGFTQGVSMSGDLKDPGKSLPRGTFLAVGVSLVVYVGAVLVFAAALPAAVLATDNSAMRQVSVFSWLVDAGVVAATLSSALASFLGAPRILQSLAADRVFPWLRPFAVGHGPAGNPRRGVLLAAAIAFGTIALGNLNAIAPVVSMFFLISYGLLNYATYVEAKANSPSFRPRFRFFHKHLSLLGGLACLGAMLAIHPTAGALAMALLFAVYQYLSQNSGVDRWAAGERSRRFQRLRSDVMHIAKEAEHPRYWRPVMLAFAEQPERRATLLLFARWLEGNSGLTTVVRMLQGEGPAARRLRDESEKTLRAELETAGLPAFPRVVVVPDLDAAIPAVLQSYGLGPVRANTVLLDWVESRTGSGADAGEARVPGGYPRVALRFGCNLVIVEADSRDLEEIEALRPAKRTIDVWYRDNATGRLMLLLAYLMTRSEAWEAAKIRLLVHEDSAREPDEQIAELRQMLEDVRIPAQVELAEAGGEAAIVRRSCTTSVVFLPVRLDEAGPASVYGGDLDELVPALKVAVLVLAAQDIELDSEPEAGEFAERARALDAEEKAHRVLERIVAETAEAQRTAEELEARVEQARAEGLGELEDSSLERAAAEARQEADQAQRRLARARAKAETATDERGRGQT